MQKLICATLAALAGAIKIAVEDDNCTDFTGYWVEDQRAEGATTDEHPISLSGVCEQEGTLTMTSGDDDGPFHMKNGRVVAPTMTFRQVFDDGRDYMLDCTFDEGKCTGEWHDADKG